MNLPGLECHTAGLNSPLHNDDQLEFFFAQIISRHVIERRLLVNDVHDLQGPDEEYTGLLGGVWGHLEAGHLLGHLTLSCRVPP